MTRADDWREHSEPYPGSHCHAANDLLEYVVFDNAQILPCYVIHLDLGRDAAQYLAARDADRDIEAARFRSRMRTKQQERNLDPQLSGGPRDIKRSKEAVKAHAKKYFPYGYGPVKGDKIQILEIGAVSEDEEDCGEYQTDRFDGLQGGQIVDIWSNGTEDFALDPEISYNAEDIANQEDRHSGDKEVDTDAETGFSVEYGPTGRTKFDHYYEARKAKVKKTPGNPRRTIESE